MDEGFAEHYFSWPITIEPHGIYGSNFAYLFFNIVQPLVCKMVIRLCHHVFYIIIEYLPII